MEFWFKGLLGGMYDAHLSPASFEHYSRELINLARLLNFVNDSGISISRLKELRKSLMKQLEKELHES